MKTLLITNFLICSFISLHGQSLVSGEYQSGLKIAFDKNTKVLTGYYENGTGWDESLNSSKFSCIFYIEGIPDGNVYKLKTYFPDSAPEEEISGTLDILDNRTIQITLTEEHGGCWNVQHFKNEPVRFSLEEENPWIQIRYIKVDKAYFYSEKSGNRKPKSYLVKQEIVCVEILDESWAYCFFSGKKETKGWIKTEDLN